MNLSIDNGILNLRSDYIDVSVKSLCVCHDYSFVFLAANSHCLKWHLIYFYNFRSEEFDFPMLIYESLLSFIPTIISILICLIEIIFLFKIYRFGLA